MKEVKRLKHLKRVKRRWVLSPGSREFRIPRFLVFCFLLASRVRGNAANIGNITNNGNIGNIGNTANNRDGWDKWDKWDIWNTRPGREICDVEFGTLDLHLRIVNF